MGSKETSAIERAAPLTVCHGSTQARGLLLQLWLGMHANSGLTFFVEATASQACCRDERSGDEPGRGQERTAGRVAHSLCPHGLHQSGWMALLAAPPPRLQGQNRLGKE